MNFAQITIYDIVGYFFPGVVSLFGVYLILCPYLMPLEHYWIVITLVKWCILGLSAYIAGHCIQGIANWLDKLLRSTSGVDQILSARSGSVAVKTATRHLSSIINVKEEEIKSQMLYEIMDSYVVQKGKTEIRDIYVYREGFYRGLCVAYVIVAIGILIRLLSCHCYKVFGGRISLTNTLLYCFLVPSVFAIVIFYQRFRRFETYRINFALHSFLVLNKNNEGKE